MPYESTINVKGQTTFPKVIRDSLGLVARDKLHFSLLSNGAVILRAKKLSIKSLYGLLNEPNRKPITIEDMNWP